MMDEAGASRPTATAAAPDAVPPVRRGRARRTSGRFGLIVLLGTIVFAFSVAFAVLAMTGRPIRLPVWAVAEVEARLNSAVLPGTGLPQGAAVALGGLEITVGRDFVPRFRLEDLRILKPGGAALLILPEARVALDPGALIEGRLSPSSLRISGARVELRRDAGGAFDIAFAGGAARLGTLAEVLDAADAAFARPALSSLTTIEAEALTFGLSDARAGRRWEVGDGRLVIENTPDGLRAEARLSVLSGSHPAQAVVTVITARGDSGASLSAEVEGVAAPDLAAMAPPLSWLSVVDAPISGRIGAALTGAGQVAAMDGTLRLGAGAVQARAEAAPIPFERAEMALTYDPAAASILMSHLSVESTTLRLKATGKGYLLGPDGHPAPPGTPPDAYLGQLQVADVRVDPAGLFVEPVRFSAGAVDLRLRLDPFRLDLGQLGLAEGDQRLHVTGGVTATAQGWQGALDVGLNRITAANLMRLWPRQAVARTRAWLVDNVQDGTLFDVKAALRLTPGQEPRFVLGYEFADTDVRFLKTLPPIRDGAGRATIEGARYTMVLDSGHVRPPKGEPIDMAGSVFSVPDIAARPARAEVRLVTDSPLTSALSILDEPPFRFLAKAEKPVDLGTGRARFRADIAFPLVAKVMLEDVDYTASGTISDLVSDVIVPGRQLSVPELAVRVDGAGLSLSGQGRLGAVPFDVTYTQGFSADQRGKSKVEGEVTLSADTLADLGIDLPAGTVGGEGRGQITVAMEKGQPPRLRLVSDLNRMTLSLPPLSWSKGPAARGRLEAEAILSQTPEVTRLTLDAPGLAAQGRVTTRSGGGLDLARFDTLRVGDWLDAAVELRGQGKGRSVGIAVTGGRLDLRAMPDRDGVDSGAGGLPFSLALDEVVVTRTQILQGFRGEFATRGGLNGQFTAMLNGRGPLLGTVVPGRAGTAVRLRSDDAGAVLSAAGVMENGRGGQLDLRMQPTGGDGEYVGRADFRDLRVSDAPVLAELLSAVSVVGLLEQLNGRGIVFGEGEVDFRLSPRAVQITRGSAIGLSLGISMAGLYRTDTGRLDLQGVVSPIYMLNGIGAMFSRRGEGVFGFNYRLSGLASSPEVSVNPLSILTPGMFREIFRRAPPTMKDAG